MRASVLIGLALVAVGFVALYQVKNGFLMSSLSQAYYAPPEDPADLQPAFEKLGGMEAADGGFYLRQIAQARIICTLRQTTELPEDAAIEAFRRLNLMLLGAGVNSLSPVIDPQIHYIGEIRRSYLRETATWRPWRLNNGEQSRMDDLFEALTAIKHPAYADLPLGDGFNHYALRAMVTAMRDKGEAVHTCVDEAKAAA